MLMRTFFSAGIVLLAIAGLCFGQANPKSSAAAKPSVEQILTKLENDWNAYSVKRDAAGLGNLLAEDYMETDWEGAVWTKAQAVANLKSGEFTATSMVADDIKVRSYGNFAVVTGRNVTRARFKGRDVSGTYRWTDTWHNRDGRWVCVASHGSKVAGK